LINIETLKQLLV